VKSRFKIEGFAIKIDFVIVLRLGIVRLFEMNSSTGTSIMNSSAASSATKAKRVAKKTDEVVAAPAPAPVAPVVAPAVPATTEVKKAGRKAATPAPAVTAPTPSPAPVATAPATTEAPAAPATTLDDDLKSVLTSLVSFRDTLSSMITEVKRLDKRVHREIKDARRRKRRVRTEGENGEPVKRRLTIFEIPTKVSDELCRFLGHPAGTLISRSNVTKQLNTYVKEKNLKNKHNITPDAPLRKLLQVPETEQLTYFNLQKYLNKHYIKEVKPSA
jgi:hypothetical protein